MPEALSAHFDILRSVRDQLGESLNLEPQTLVHLSKCQTVLVLLFVPVLVRHRGRLCAAPSPCLVDCAPRDSTCVWLPYPAGVWEAAMDSHQDDRSYNMYNSAAHTQQPQHSARGAPQAKYAPPEADDNSRAHPSAQGGHHGGYQAPPASSAASQPAAKPAPPGFGQHGVPAPPGLVPAPSPQAMQPLPGRV